MAENERKDDPFDSAQDRPEQGGAASKDDNTGDSGGKPFDAARKTGLAQDRRPKKLPALSAGRRVLLRTFGCQMNVRDSEVICGFLQKKGYKLVDKPEDADIVLFNTCSVRQHAEDKVWSEIGRIAKVAKRAKTGTVAQKRGQSLFLPIIGLVGCMAQNYKEKIFERSPEVDFVAGPSDIDKIPGIIKKIRGNNSENGEKGDSPQDAGTVPIFPMGQSLFLRKIWETDGDIRPEEIYHTGFYQDKEHAFVVISEGCSNYCSYCVVPYVRGELRHRNCQEIIKEIEEAVDRGIAKITLLGQNVNAYHWITGKIGKIGTVPKMRGQSLFSTKAGTGTISFINFIDLLKLVNQIKGLNEFSFITSHPKDTSIELFKAMQELDKLKKYLHLPVQAGSDKILKAMNRGYTRKYYFELTDNYRKMVKGGVLTTDIIVGYPGETEEDFRDTYNLLKEIKFSAAYIFKYSPRPHTQAAQLVDDVTKEEKERRHRLILDLQKEISRKSNSKQQKSK